MRNNYILMMIILGFFMSCENKAPRIEDVICGRSFRYWYKQGVPNRYHYFDVNGRKENFCVSRSGNFMEILMLDFEMSTTWKPINDSTIIMYYDIEYHVKIINKETIVLNDDTLHVLKDYKYIPKDYQKLLGDDIVTGGFGKQNRIIK
jgi:hypothetical protein